MSNPQRLDTPRAARRGGDVFLLAAIAAVGVAFLLWMRASDRTFFAFPDNSEQFWPWYQKAAALLHDGQLTLWDANTNAGHSYVGETQTGVFYPLNLLWLQVLGSPAGIGPERLDALVVLHAVIAASGLALLARELGADRLVAFATGIVFAFSGPLFARAPGQTAIFFGLALLPWALLFAVRFARSGRLTSAAGAGAAIGLSILAGHFQPAFHGLIAVAVVGLVVPAMPTLTWRRRVAGAGVFGIALAVVAAPQLAYSLPYLARAYRFTSEPVPTPPGEVLGFDAFVRDYSGGPGSLLSMLNPQVYDVADGNTLYVGLATLIAAGLAFTVLRRGAWSAAPRMAVAAAVLIGVGLAAILGGWSPVPRLLHTLPFVAQVRELGRYSILVHLGLAMLFAIALARLFAADAPLLTQRARRGWLIVGGALVANGLYLWIEQVPTITRWFAVQVALAGAVAVAVALPGSTRRTATRVALAALLALAGVASASRAVGSTASPLYPPRDYQRTGVITAVERLCQGHRTLVLDDALPRNVADVFRTIRTHNGFGATMHVPFYDLINGAPIAPDQRALLDLRCIVATTSQPPAGYRPRYRDAATGTTVWVDRTTGPLTDPTLKTVPSTTLVDDDRRRKWVVDLAAPTTITISSILYPGWKLRVNGSERTPGKRTVNGTPVFPTVDLPAGRHTIEWSWNGLPAA